MSSRPILFSGAMVRALLDGTKTQTRRVAKLNAWSNPHHAGNLVVPDYYTAAQMTTERIRPGPERQSGALFTAENGADVFAPCPYGVPGDTLWVRETFYDDCGLPDGLNDKQRREYIYYRADGEAHAQLEDHNGLRWRPSIFMPRWASRLTLEITDIRVQRVQAISEEDAKTEGMPVVRGNQGEPGACFIWRGLGYHGAGFNERREMTFHVPDANSGRCRCHVAGPTPAQCAYRELWGSINAKRPGSAWADDPWVWALTFSVATVAA